MENAITIEQFHALLISGSEERDSSLLTALRQLMAIEEPEEILAVAVVPSRAWSTWQAI